MTLLSLHNWHTGDGQAWRRGLALLITAALSVPPVLLTGVAASAAPPATAVPGGPVVLDGNDPSDHVGQVTTYVQRVYTNLDANVAAGYSHNGKVAVIGTCAAMLNNMGTGETFEQFDTAAAVAALFGAIGANNYKHVHICSDDDTTLTTAVQNELSNWGSAIANHVNRGGGLFATGHRYRWLTSLFPSLVVTYGGTGSSYVTPDGEAFFQTLPANTQVNAINHFTFTGSDATPLRPLLTQYVGAAGLRVAIGGTTVRFPQIAVSGPTTGSVGATETYTLTAVTADGNVLSNNTFTYTITGPTSAATTGTATTDANGQYVFTFAADARGRTSVVVNMALGDGTAAGATASTSWLSLASEPTGLTAEVVTGNPDSVQLDWTAPATSGLTPVSDYVIEQSVDGITWTTVTDGSSTTTSYTVTGLDANTSYRFRVAAVNGDGNGPWSEIAASRPFAPNDLTFARPADMALASGTGPVSAEATSGLPVSFASGSMDVCTVTGSTVTLVKAGTCQLTASQAGDRTFLPASPVTRTFAVLPAAPAPAAVSSTGTGSGAQTATVVIPAQGSVTLLDAQGAPATTVTVPGQGTYSLDAATGAIQFVPVAGFSGKASGVTFRVTDAFGQSGTGTFTPTVTAAAVADPTTPMQGDVRLGAGSRATVSTRRGTVPVSCQLDGGAVSSVNTVTRCTVRVFAKVDGKRVLVGTGTVAYPAWTEPEVAVAAVRLTREGRQLARSPGGRPVRVLAAVVPADGTTAVTATSRSRLVAKSFVLPRPVFFGTSSSRLHLAGQRYLDRLRPKLGGVQALTCTGYTDANGSPGANTALGMARAKAACERLTRGKWKDVTVRLRTLGERQPHANNRTSRGRTLNRRTEIRLHY